MANIQSILKAEIARISRKEVRQATADVKKSNSTLRGQVAALRRQVDELSRALKRVSREGKAAKMAADREELQGDQAVRRRFRADGFASMRKRLQLSAQHMGALIGVTGQTIYKWEKEESKPRAAQLEAIAAVRELGPRAAQQKLEEMGVGTSAAKNGARAAHATKVRPVTQRQARRQPAASAGKGRTPRQRRVAA